MKHTHASLTALLLALGGLGLLCLAGASQQAFAQQSTNHALHAVPAGKVVVDGKLDDWDLSGQIEVYANFKTRNSYSAKVAAMYDKDNFYLSLVRRDPTPMHNMVDSNFDIGSGWKSDCVQLRLKTDRVIGDVSCAGRSRRCAFLRQENRAAAAWVCAACARNGLAVARLGSYTPKCATGTRFEQLEEATSAAWQGAATAPGGCD